MKGSSEPFYNLHYFNSSLSNVKFKFISTKSSHTVLKNGKSQTSMIHPKESNVFLHFQDENLSSWGNVRQKIYRMLKCIKSESIQETLSCDRDLFSSGKNRALQSEAAMRYIFCFERKSLRRAALSKSRHDNDNKSIFHPNQLTYKFASRTWESRERRRYPNAEDPIICRLIWRRGSEISQPSSCLAQWSMNTPIVLCISSI